MREDKAVMSALANYSVDPLTVACTSILKRFKCI